MKINSIITALLMLVSLAGFAQANKQTDEKKLVFVDGVSPDRSTNDFFTSICRYLKDE